MLLDFRAIIRKHHITPRGILHLGAHDGFERTYYGDCPTWWVEARAEMMPTLEANLRDYPTHRAICAAVWDSPGPITFNVSNNGESSSAREFGTHAAEHPTVRWTEVGRQLEATTVDALVDEYSIEANVIVADLQSAELPALKGGTRFLKGCDAAYLEVNTRPLYEGCELLPEVMGWMATHGFEMREMCGTVHGWHDAFFVRLHK